MSLLFTPPNIRDKVGCAPMKRIAYYLNGINPAPDIWAAVTTKNTRMSNISANTDTLEHLHIPSIS